MTPLPPLQPVYVEGDDDINILSRWFPAIQLKAANGKDAVMAKVERDPKALGVRDRDFASDKEVSDSREPASRVAILKRYCIENYLLEPNIISAAVVGFAAHGRELAAWTDEGHVRTQIRAWGQELALYAAANSIVNEWRGIIEADFLRYFGPLPALSYAAVLGAMQERLRLLTRPEDLPAALKARHQEVQSDVANWDGLHRWINGKVLLEECLYPQVSSLVTNLG